jgi:tartrate dehydratase alpha subunit/fumarate hydratase class I-like protein
MSPEQAPNLIRGTLARAFDKNRLPASYFVSISYVCWAYRRQGVTLDAQGKIGKWLY